MVGLDVTQLQSEEDVIKQLEKHDYIHLHTSKAHLPDLILMKASTLEMYKKAMASLLDDPQ